MTTPNREARKSVRLVSVELGFTIFLQFVSGIALARILAPQDFGLFGITVTVFGLAGLLTDWGAKQRLIQARSEPDSTTLKIALTSRLLLCALVIPALQGEFAAFMADGLGLDRGVVDQIAMAPDNPRTLSTLQAAEPGLVATEAIRLDDVVATEVGETLDRGIGRIAELAVGREALDHGTLDEVEEFGSLGSFVDDRFGRE